MRRLPISGSGLFVIAAAAVPIIIKSSKPLAKKIGQAMEKYGAKLQEAAAEEVRNKHKTADKPTEEPTQEQSSQATSAEPKAEVAEPAPKANKPPQAKPTTKSTAKPKPKKTVKATPATKKPTPPKPKD
jgi:hypothetical protein